MASANDNLRPVFPKQWGWQSYEPALQELVLRSALARLQPDPHDEKAAVLSAWFYRKQQEKKLPSPREISAKGREFVRIFKRLERQAYKRLQDLERQYATTGSQHIRASWQRFAEQQKKPTPDKSLDRSPEAAHKPREAVKSERAASPQKEQKQEPLNKEAWRRYIENFDAANKREADKSMDRGLDIGIDDDDLPF